MAEGEAECSAVSWAASPCEGKPLVRGGDLRPRCWSGRRGEAEKGAETGSPGISHNSEKSSGAGR